MAKKKPNVAKIKKRLTPNKPETSYKPDKKFMVLAKVGSTEKLLHFGAKGYGHNYSTAAREGFRARMGCDKGSISQLTPKYWACEFLWKEGGRKRTQATKGGAAVRRKKKK